MPHRAILLSIACLLSLAPAAHAAGFVKVGQPQRWDHIYAGTRSEAMGQADLAVSQGPMSIFDNPAPLPAGRAVQAAYGHMDYVLGLWFDQYAAAAEMGAFRLGFARMDFRSDDIAIRTAYNPEGTGETFRLDDRVMIISGSLDVAHLLAPGSPWQWTFGLAHRDYRASLGIDNGGASHTQGLDLGSSIRGWRRLGRTRLIASAAGVLRNIDYDNRAPEDTRLGLGLSLAVDGERSRDVIVLTLAYLFKDIRAEQEYFGDRHYGAELTLLQVLAVRVGHDEQIFGGTSQYGVGVTLPRQWLGPFGVTFDWSAAEMGYIGKIGVTDKASFESISVMVQMDM